MQKTKSNTSPKISVIVPVYNTEKFLPTCLESIINQTYQNLEIIIINDGSTDSSLTLCEQYQKQDKRIKIINKKNEGQAIARNTGIKEATGNYIHFIDSDDFISLNYYENMLKAGAKTNADILLGEVYNEKHPNTSIKYQDIYLLKNLDDKIYKTLFFIHGWCWRYLIKREFVLKNNLSFTKGHIIEDIPFTLSAAIAANKIITVPGAEYFYRFNTSSSMNNKKEKKKRDSDRTYAQNLIKNILKPYNLKLKGNLLLQKIHYKLFGIFPIASKSIYTKKTIYKFLGLKIWQVR